MPGATARQLHPKVRTLWLVGGIVSDAVAIALLTGITVVVVANTQLDPHARQLSEMAQTDATE